jgi:hypothetical protein
MRSFGSIALCLAVPFAIAPFVVGCPSSGTVGEAPPQDAGSSDVVVPDTAACMGDPKSCLSGKMTLSGFTVAYEAAKVELYRVFPNGAAAPVDFQILAKDGTFAFSGVNPWAHYYLRGVVRFGDPMTGSAVATTRGRFVVPIAAGTSFDLVVQPVQLELLETKSAGSRALAFVSAHVYDPASGRDLTDAVVTFNGSGSPTPMPYTTNASGTKSYYVAFNPPVAANGAFSIATSHAALGATPITWDMTPEASLFDGALTAPADGASIKANTDLPVTWPAQANADYAIVLLFSKANGMYTATYVSPSSIASDVSSETIPGSKIPSAGTYLLNVDTAQAACQLGTTKGCTYLIHPASATLTAQ